MTIDLSPTQVVAVLGVGLALLMMWRSGTRRGRRAGEAAHAGSRVASLAGHLLGTAGVIVGVQWVAIPALITAHALTRSVASMDTYWRGDRR
jgi:branched-subunit amino acid permease